MKLVTPLVPLVALAMIPIHTARADEDLDRGMHWEGAFGLRAGSFPVGPFHGSGVGLHVDGGLRFDRLFVYGEWSWLSLSNTTETDSTGASRPIAVADTNGTTGTTSLASDLSGGVHRFGANARYSFAKIGGGSFPLRGDFWVEGGVGYQRISWDGGGELSRPDLALGIGGQWSVWWGEAGARKHAGLFYALRVQIAQRPGANPDSPATCAGPCDEATKPDTLDRAYMFNMGIIFGG